jgi:hypothetical protein
MSVENFSFLKKKIVHLNLRYADTFSTVDSLKCASRSLPAKVGKHARSATITPVSIFVINATSDNVNLNEHTS